MASKQQDKHEHIKSNGSCGLMRGKKGLIMGVANNHSIAWGIAKKLHEQGAKLAFSYQNEAFIKRLQPLVDTLDHTSPLLACDVGKAGDIPLLFEQVEEVFDSLDFVVHAIAYSDKMELKGQYIDTTRENFLRTMDISCYSFTQVAKCASKLMNSMGSDNDIDENGATRNTSKSILTLTYDGANRVMPNYNVMGIAKAALEASVRYLAADLGVLGVRVNGISAGPVRTLAGSAIADARLFLKWARHASPLKKLATIDKIGDSAVYLLSDMASCVTGEIHYVDSGFNIVGIPRIEELFADVLQ